MGLSIPCNTWKKGDMGGLTLSKLRAIAHFKSHPPTQLRRDNLSVVSYVLLTGMDITSCISGLAIHAWQVIAQNVASKMSECDRLFGVY